MPPRAAPFVMTPDASLRDHARKYLANRRNTYDRRIRRFAVVAEALKAHVGLDHNDVLYDIGAGHCQFDYFLREEGWHGAYVPVDASIDGVDLNAWTPPPHPPDAYVLMEVVEHLVEPLELLAKLEALKGIVLTTPNHGAVDVMGCDEDHRSIVTADQLIALGFTVTAEQFFGTPRDTLVAWRRA